MGSSAYNKSVVSKVTSSPWGETFVAWEATKGIRQSRRPARAERAGASESKQVWEGVDQFGRAGSRGGVRERSATFRSLRREMLWSGGKFLPLASMLTVKRRKRRAPALPQRGNVIQPSVGGPSRTGEERLRWVGVKKKSQPQRG